MPNRWKFNPDIDRWLGPLAAWATFAVGVTTPLLIWFTPALRWAVPAESQGLMGFLGPFLLTSSLALLWLAIRLAKPGLAGKSLVKWGLYASLLHIVVGLLIAVVAMTVLGMRGFHGPN